MRRLLASTSATLLALTGYGVLDVYDRVPGILTRDQAPASASAAATPTSSPTVALPSAPSRTAAVALPPSVDPASAPTAAGVRAAVAPTLAPAGLGPSVGVVIGDASGTVLYEQGASTPRTPASTAKLLTAAAVASQLTPADTMTTSVVQGGAPDEIVLVAGGDTMLAPGTGRAASVEGRAGLAELARQTAAALGSQRRVTLRLDLTYAAGPALAPGWSPFDVAAGYTQGVWMIGLAGQRPTPGDPSPTDPPAAVASAFVHALKARGITATTAPRSQWERPAPTGARVLGSVRSAPTTDVLALALDDSDNALTENLARQAALRGGRGTSFAESSRWVRDTVAGLGVDLDGATLTDSSGLTSGQRLPVRVLGELLALAASGDRPGLREVVAQLPVAGVDGSLHERYLAGPEHRAAGVARAKTGTLTGTSGLAGTLVARDGHLLTYAIVADRVPASTGTLGARTALDRFVATLAACGCH